MHVFYNDEKLEVSDEFQSVGWNYGDIMMLAGILKEETRKQCILMLFAFQFTSAD